METIEEEIKEAQNRLSKRNVDFLEFVKKNPGTLKSSNFKLLELNDPIFKLQPWPTFINGKSKEAFREAGEKLYSLIKSIPRRVFNNDPYKISDYFGVPLNAVKLQLEGVTDNHIDGLLARGDFIFSPSGLKCLEYNVTPILGGLQVPVWESLYLKTPIISQFLKEYNVKINNKNLISIFLEEIVRSPLKAFPDETEINIAIALNGFVEVGKENTTGIYLNKLYSEILHRINKSKNPSLQGEVIICDYQHLDVGDDYVGFKNKKIHALVEMYHGLVPPGILKVFKAGNICIMNGPISTLFSNKLTLPVLSDYEVHDAFTDEEKKIIDTYLPWSRKIVPGSTTYGGDKIHDLEDFILSNRKMLVIKPAVGYGGDGICIGQKSSQKQWERVVKTAFNKGNWLVQELVESAPGFYQAGENGYDLHDTVWGFFVFGSRYSGAWARVMPRKDGKGIINCHQGATVSVIFETED